MHISTTTNIHKSTVFFFLYTLVLCFAMQINKFKPEKQKIGMSPNRLLVYSFNIIFLTDIIQSDSMYGFDKKKWVRSMHRSAAHFTPNVTVSLN